MAEENQIPEGAFGGRISDEIVTQLDRRASVRKKSAKSVKEHTYLNSNTPWILLRSGVDVPAFTGDTPSSRLAGQYVLAGGTLVNFGEYGFLQRHGVESFSSTPAYTMGSMGFRPKPGITSIEVKTKDTWGCIMEATVNFVVWSLDDLNDIDKLYFRPGMTALLEWGHSIYVNNEGEIKTAEVKTEIVPNKLFYSNSTFEEIDKGVQRCREGSNGNYEGMFGYITNFSYTFKKSGGYDCTLKLLSKGTVIEGITVTKTNNSSSTESSELDSSIKSEYHRLFERLKGLNMNNVDATYTKNGLKVRIYIKTVQRGTKQVKLFYIRLKDLLDIINEYNKSSGLVFETNTEYIHYVRFAEELSLNPYVAILPRSGMTIKTGKKSWTMYELVDRFNPGSPVNKLDDILINYNYFVELIDHNIDDKTGEFKLVEVLQDLLANMQKAFGNINNFGMHYNHVTCTWTIVDRNCINDVDTVCPEISVSGLGGTVRELSISSEVSTDIVNEMSIAATAPTDGGGKTDASANIINWNEGSVNRHIVENKKGVSSGNSESENNENSEEELTPLGIWYNRKAFEDYMDKFEKLYKKFGGTSRIKKKEGTSVGDAAEASYSELQLTAESVYSRFINRDIKNRKTAGSLQTGIMPVKVGITLDGISRFVVGTSFKISPGILPSKYDNWGYIVTGVENRVDKSGWITSVQTQYYPIYGKVTKEVSTGKPVNSTSQGSSVPTKTASTATRQSVPASAKKVVQMLMGHGVPKNDAIGIVGNLCRESSLKTTAVGDRGTSFGLAQWHKGGEAEEMVLYFRKKPGQESFVAEDIANLSLEQQVEYVAHVALNETRTKGKGQGRAKFTGYGSPEEACEIWCRYYERPAAVDNEVSIRTGITLQIIKEVG